jgi:hypothetical protein
MKHFFDIRKADQPGVTFEYDIHSFLVSDTLENLAFCLWVILEAPQPVTDFFQKVRFLQ